MSRETSEWLNQNVLIGFTEKRGHAWHYRESAQGAEANHYPLAVPATDVSRRLFDWEPLELPVLIPAPMKYYENEDASDTAVESFHEIDGRKAIVPSDNPTHVFGIFSQDYQVHSYDEWLIGNVSNILGDTLAISSAGLLKGRAVAWVEVSVPETITTPQGVAFRPNLLATTSLDGTVATTYKRTCTMVVCDNTWGMAMTEKGQTYKRKHTRYSNGKLEQDRAREALNLVHETADAMQDEIRHMCEIEITNAEFNAILNAVTAPPAGKAETKTGVTVRERKMDEVRALYVNDERVAPWNGTAFGVVQAFNTWGHHVKPTRGETERAERNALDTINGNTEKADAVVWAAIQKELDLMPF